MTDNRAKMRKAAAALSTPRSRTPLIVPGQLYDDAVRAGLLPTGAVRMPELPADKLASAMTTGVGVMRVSQDGSLEFIDLADFYRSADDDEQSA